MRKLELVSLAMAVWLGLIHSSSNAIAAASDEPLVQQSNLLYEGAFRVPQIGLSADANSYNYGGTSLGYNPANNLLYVVGFVQQQYFGEIGIPEIRKSAS